MNGPTISDRWRRALTALVLLALCGWCRGELSAQVPPTPPAPEVEFPRRDDLEMRLKGLENSGLDETVKAKAREQYQRALQELDNLERRKKALVQFELQSANAPADLAKAKAALAQPLPRAPTPPLDAVSLESLEEQLATLEPEARASSDELARLELERRTRDARLVEIPKLSASALEELPQIDKRLAESPPPGEATDLSFSRRAYDQLRKAALEASLKSWEAERLANQATAELIRLQRDLAARQVATLQQEVQALQGAINQRRRQEATEQAQEARISALQATPALAELASRVTKLADERRVAAEQIDKLTQLLQQSRLRLEDLTTKFERSQEKVQAIGLTHASGQLLRREQASLPNLYDVERSIYLRGPVIGDVRLKLYERQDERFELANQERALAELLDKLGSPPTPQLEASAAELLVSKRKLLDDLIADYNAWSQLLLELDATEEQLVVKVRAYQSFIAERVLWIRSAAVLGPADLQPAKDAVWWLLSPENWRSVVRVLGEDLRTFPLYLPLFLAAWLPLVYVQGRLRQRIADVGAQAQRSSCVDYLLTLRGVVLTVLISLVWPAALAYIGWRILQSYSATDFSRALGSAISVSAVLVLGLQLVRQACRPAGLAAAHFGWPENRVRLLWRQMRWLLFTVVPLVAVTSILAAQTTEPLWSESLGRGAMLLALVVSSLFLLRIFQPADGLVAAAFGPQSLAARFKRLWQVAIAGGPLFLAVLTAAGYYYTEQQLSQRLLQTLGLIAVVIGADGLLTRWVLINRRRLAMEQFRQRRAAAAAAQSPRGESSSQPPAPDPEEELVNLATISEQTRNLLNTILVVLGLALTWFIWGDILPALTLLRNFTLWSGQPSVTLADFLLAILVVIVTYIATKNVPGLLELAVLQHLPLDAGARYAITTLCRYVITIVGIILGCGMIGFRWDSVQWLVAAVGVGLGFGLQEIFANFVSGIILLFERPIRVGDIVTLGDTSGVVTRIRMRATTITDWDRKEFIIPNKDLITGRLLNWTLSDTMNRIVITVGVAYGSDTNLARRLLLDVARDNPHVLKDPAPMASFEAFADSSLTIVLRCFLPDLTRRLDVIHDLHTAVHSRFLEAGIEISYPQRDLHIRSWPPGLEASLHERSNGAATK